MELTILHFFASLHNEILNTIMYICTLFGEKGIFWIVIALLFLFALPKRYRKVGVSVGIALLLSIVVCNLLLKNITARPRPFWVDPTLIDADLESRFHLYSKIDDFSFPSGHTSASIGAAVAIRMWRKWEGNVAIIIAVLVSLSRIYLCVHYPTDVLTSAALGVAFGIAGYYFSKWFINKWPITREIFKGGKSYFSIFKKKEQ